jgi:transcriptional regulator with XRE-family HTH domain
LPELNTSWEVIGQRLRAARTAERMSVRELARRIAVSPSHVSQVERGIGAFSVPVLYAVASELDVSIHELLDPESPEEPAGSVEGGKTIIQRASARASIQLEAGPRWSRLTPDTESDAEFLEVVYAPATPAPTRPIIHEGREYGVVTAGELTVEVDGVVDVLQPGDSVAFDSLRPHRFWNDSAAEVRAIWFVRDRAAGETAPHA